MLAQFIWWSAIVLEALLLARFLRERIIRRYPLFSAYIAYVLLANVLLFCCYRVDPGFYPKFYWYMEFIPAVAGYGVIMEIYKRSLANHPGVARLAQNLLLLVLFAALVEVAVHTFNRPFASWAVAVTYLGRDLRYAEGALLLVVLGLFSRYRIHGGRNLEGLILGYGFFIGTDVVNLAFLSHPGNESSVLLRQLLPVAYLIALVIWCSTMWSYQPEPVPPPEDQIEREYRVLAERTRTTLARATNNLVRPSRRP